LTKSDIQINVTDLKASFVYADTQAYRELQMDWNGRILRKLRDLSRTRVVRLLVTDITKREVKDKLREKIQDTVNCLRKAEIILRQLDLDHALSKLKDEEPAVERLAVGFEDYLRACDSIVIPLSVDLSNILDDYFHRRAPFGHGKKKTEFPDAFVVSSLKAWCLKTNNSIYVVSRDGDLKNCCSMDGPLIHAETIAEIISSATVREEIERTLTKALDESPTFHDLISKELQTLRPESSESIEFASQPQLDSFIVHEVNVIERRDDYFLTNVELEIEFTVELSWTNTDSIGAQFPYRRLTQLQLR
jgi:hypothetical protein